MLTHYGVNKGSVLNVGITIINYSGSMSIVGVNPKKKNLNEQAIVNQAIACFCIW